MKVNCYRAAAVFAAWRWRRSGGGAAAPVAASSPDSRGSAGSLGGGEELATVKHVSVEVSHLVDRPAHDPAQVWVSQSLVSTHSALMSTAPKSWL